MYKIFVLLSYMCYSSVSGYFQEYSRTLHGNVDFPVHTAKSLVVDSSLYDGWTVAPVRKKRSVASNNVSEIIKVNHLHDSHKILMVQYISGKSGAIICLAVDAESPYTTSSVFISYNDGDSYNNKTENFKMPNGNYATLNKMYYHHENQTHILFTDIMHNWLYLTNNIGETIESKPLTFTPSEIVFHETDPTTFLVLDKNKKQLWLTEDFGKTFILAFERIKSFHWVKDGHENSQLIVQKDDTNDSSSVVYSGNLFRTEVHDYSTGVEDLFLKGNYLFTTKFNARGNLILYASHKLDRQLPCVFDSPQRFLSYFILDVTESHAFIVASHPNKSSTLYVSEDLRSIGNKIRFNSSLENVFAFFPSDFQNISLPLTSREAFVDVHKVDGMNGIYIASKLNDLPDDGSLRSENIKSVITFDYGATWHLIPAPSTDSRGLPTQCELSRNCSLHLTQRFNEISSDSRTMSIISSKSAPGLIMATGVLGKSLEGRSGVYVSSDAGQTWRQTLDGSHLFTFGDHGSILAAVKDSWFISNEVKYSTDGGEHWKEINFHARGLRMCGLLTETDENTVFTLFGSQPNKFEWIVVKVDLGNIFNRTCSKSDYELWSPSLGRHSRGYNIPCNLGQRITYDRKIPNADCMYGSNYVRNISKQSCSCDISDYECDSGFISIDNPRRCVLAKSQGSYDPYAIPTTCSPGQFYNRTKGYRKIPGNLCTEGSESQFMPDIVACPYLEENGFLLLAQSQHISRYNFTTQILEELPIKNLGNVSSVDYDIFSDCVIWADRISGDILKQCFGNSTVVTLDNFPQQAVVGIALDWISKTLYIVNGDLFNIQIIKTNMNTRRRRRSTLVNSTVLSKPRGIAVHPQAGYMFWTDCQADYPSINRAYLDGSNIVTLFNQTVVQFPTEITVDYTSNRIYWIDTQREYIGSSDLNGIGFLKVVSDNEYISHPFGVVIHKEDLYWQDRKSDSVLRVDKDTVENVKVVIKEVSRLTDLKAFIPRIQNVSNGCSNSSCPYICVGLLENNFTCLCPDGLILRYGKCVCPREDHFTCSNDMCIPNRWKCDGENDCIDNSDEQECINSTCPALSFACDNGKCIPSNWRCDNDFDCNDRTDEIGCSNQNCTDDQFPCGDGNPTGCGVGQVQCKSGQPSCIPSAWVCDFENDCGDNSDESDCEKDCSDPSVPCEPSSDQCVHKSKICDGIVECRNGKDEANCPLTLKRLIAAITQKPETKSLKNSTDSCTDWMIPCENLHCIPTWWRCDGADDCGDGTDERDCT